MPGTLPAAPETISQASQSSVYLWLDATTGNIPSGGVNDPAQFSAYKTGDLSPGDNDILPIVLFAGQTVTFDFDSSGAVDARIDVIDQTGALVESNDDNLLDPGSSTTVDPLVNFTATRTGVYFVNVSNFSNYYVDGSFTFSNLGTTSGTYTFIASTPVLPVLTDLSGGGSAVFGNLPDRVLFGAGSDTASLFGGNDTADGGAGADTISGGSGDDVLSGGFDSDADTLNGESGNDVLFGRSDGDILNGGDNNDELLVQFGTGVKADGGAGDDLVFYAGGAAGILIGGTGIDTLSFAGGAIAADVNLALNTINTAASISGFENIIGSGMNDVLRGNSLSNVLRGLAGSDTLYGGTGNDTLVGGLGGDSMDGEGGIDTADYSLSIQGVNVNLQTNVHSGGDAAGDILQGIENVIGSQSISNVLTGNASNNTLIGGSGSDTLDGGLGNDVMIGGITSDVYFVGQAGDSVVEAPNSGDFDSVHTVLTSYTLGANVEFLWLDGIAAANGYGNGLANTITGNGFANLIDGKGGLDVMSGRAGDDRYYTDVAGEIVIENSGEGKDTVYASRTMIDPLYANVEDLVLLGTGNFAATGNGENNRITGNSGNNVLNGLGGNDVLIGGAGNDTYDQWFIGDTVVEAANSGKDKVIAYDSYVLGANIEDAEIGAVFGGYSLTGNSLVNRLIGNSGGNTLDGKAGADYMAASTGDDFYIVDNSLDATVELAAQGIDTVLSAITHTLRVNVERLELQGTANINGTGNGLNNNIKGNDGSNILNGLAGADITTGGKGNDTYYTDFYDFIAVFGDTTVEAANEGIDIVRSTTNWQLTANVEKLYLLGSAQEGIGNALSNYIYGNGAGNFIDGEGGADRLYGEGGNDTFNVDSAGDLIYETTAGAAGGTDQVNSSVNHTLSANVENLVLLGSASINGTGNGLANDIQGNSGNNFLNGMAGNDQIDGGAGQDNFVFSTALGPANVDVIGDFVPVDDTIRLDNAVFLALPAGFLSVAAFHTGGAAADASDRIIYNAATGAVLYDSDGTGAVAATRFATLDPGLALTNADFFVF